MKGFENPCSKWNTIFHAST